jgi:mannitol-specific phosphotransferase system IIBC component
MALHSATSEAKSFFVAWALLDQQKQQQKQHVQDRPHVYEEAKQSQQTTSPFAKYPTKAIEAAIEWKKSFGLVVGAWCKVDTMRFTID